MRAYICLYLISPILNNYIKYISPKQRLFSLTALGFIAIYLGTVAVIDPSLHKGGNIFTFMFFYFVGNTIRVYQNELKKIPLTWLIIAYLLLNILLVVGYCMFDGSIISKIIYRLSFPYNSPIMVVNALLMFLIIISRPFKSKSVNWFASSALAICLITESRFMIEFVFYPIVISIKNILQNDLFVFAALCLKGFVVMIICILIDKLLSPLWRWFMTKGEQCEETIIKHTDKFINGYNRGE